jgi:hypothetical protein
MKRPSRLNQSLTERRTVWDGEEVDTSETLGVVAHPGGLLVRRPELAVGVVRAVSGLSALEVELLARRPLDPRSPTERQQDRRVGRASEPGVASRRLLPAFDEGIDLRVGWLDHAGGAHWEFATSSSSDGGDHFLGTSGPRYRAVFRLPPTFDRISLVLAWPEIGFPETVITMPLPDRATVERATTSIWQAPLDVRPVPEGLIHHGERDYDVPAVETGTIVAPPRVLHRRDHAAAVVLTRVTAVDSVLSMEMQSIVKVGAADTINAHAPLTSGLLDAPEQVRERGPGASVAVIRGRDAFWVRPGDGSFSGGDLVFSGVQEFTLQHPDDGTLDLIVAWPLAGLHDVRVRIPLDPT